MSVGHCICGVCPSCDPAKLSFWGVKPVPVADAFAAAKAQGAAEERARIVKFLSDCNDTAINGAAFAFMVSRGDHQRAGQRERG